MAKSQFFGKLKLDRLHKCAHDLSVTGHFSVKVDLTQFRKYRSICNRQVQHIRVEHLLFFRIRNELQFVKAKRVISLEFPPFVKLNEVKLGWRNTIGYWSYMTNVLQ